MLPRPPPDRSADRSRALDLVPVSRETEQRFELYAELLTRWQRVKNLVAPSTLSEIWTRHIADSAQILKLAPAARRWADLGSGAGFPGLVVAISLADAPGAEVHLIEANTRKCAFLREVARECGAPATIHNGRIEDVVPTLNSIDVVTARALAPLPRLIEMGRLLIDGGATALFLKSQGETAEPAVFDPAFDVTIVPSRTSKDGRIVMLRRTGTQPASASADQRPKGSEPHA